MTAHKCAECGKEFGPAHLSMICPKCFLNTGALCNLHQIEHRYHCCINPAEVVRVAREICEKRVTTVWCQGATPETAISYDAWLRLRAALGIATTERGGGE